jgi:glyoxylate/hydroxypyruvate reductase A
MIIMLNNHGFDQAPWVRALQRELPQSEIRVFPEVGGPEDIEYAVIWNHPHGDLGRYPKLKAILLLSAGADFLIHDPSLPPDVPIVRLIDDAVAADMAQHALYFTIHFHRAYHRHLRDQARRHWQRYDYPATHKRRVGVIGFGAMGKAIALELQRAGFPVSAWVRTERSDADTQLFAGNDQLPEFLAQTDILITVLPNTPETECFIDAERLNQLPHGAFLINMGRGKSIDDDALRRALDSGQIEAAALDVFREEPLPESHWMWSHPAIFITPHVSGNTYARSGATRIAENIRRIEQGQEPYPLFNPERGY